MKVLTKVLVIGGAVAAGAVAIVAIRHSLRAGAHGVTSTSAGAMFVGAVDEVELSGPLVAGGNPDLFDPEEVPSEHSEINELRNKMPFG
jgi:hypothetical protein